MATRDKLIKVIQNAVDGCAEYWAGLIADELIKSGLVVDDRVYTQTYLGDIKAVAVYKCEKCGQNNYGKGFFCRVCGCKLKE